MPDIPEDYVTSKSAVNREDRAERLNPLLGCSICPPNRGENRKQHKKHQRSDKKQHTIDRAKSRRAKNKDK